VPELSKKIFRRNFPKLLSTGWRSDYEKFLLDSIFPTKLTEFPTKLTEFVPFIFIISQYCPTVKRILPDWLRLPMSKRLTTCISRLFSLEIQYNDSYIIGPMLIMEECGKRGLWENLHLFSHVTKRKFLSDDCILQESNPGHRNERHIHYIS
jgi:hypothetical protein